MDAAKFNFIPQQQKKSILENKKFTEKLMQWSMKGSIKLKYYNFNQQFHPYQKQDFVNAFFSDPHVLSTLEIYKNGNWHPLGVPANKVDYELIPASQTSMAFFDRILDPKNNVVRDTGHISQCFEDMVNGFYIEDHLRAVLLDENHETYALYSKSERNEFLFRLLQHFCLGGQWCQRDDKIDSYLQLTQSLYKEIISVERDAGSSDIRIRSVVLKAVAYDNDGCPLYPADPKNLQNFLYLIIDPFKRTVIALTHQYDAGFND